MPTVRSPPRARREGVTSPDLAQQAVGGAAGPSVGSADRGESGGGRQAPPGGGDGDDDEGEGVVKQVGRLDDGKYQPWGGPSLSRSSSDTSSDAAVCKGGPGKTVCGEPVKDGEDGVECEICHYWFHRCCQAMSKANYKALQTHDMVTWWCAECKLKIAKNGIQGQNQKKSGQCQCSVGCKS